MKTTLQASAEAAVLEINEAISTLRTVAVVETATGELLASKGQVPVNKLTEAVRHHAAALRQQLTSGPIDDILVTLLGQIHLIKPTSDNKYFFFMVVDSPATSLGFAREILRQIAVRFRD